MGKRIVLILLSALLAVSCLTGCASQKKAEETMPKAVEKEIVSVSEDVEANGKTLAIHTTVEVPNLETLEEITLCFSEDTLDTMVKELVHSQYPGLEEHPMDGDRKWSVETEEQLLFSLGVTDEGWETGRTYYLDCLRNLNGQDVEEDDLNSFTPYYMTEHIPDQLEMTAQEAAKAMAEYLSRYSCFTYKPWNVAAVNCRNQPDTSGYYQMLMQPQFDGIPVYGHGALQVSACLSAEGFFTFQGIMVMEEQSRKAAQASMTLEEAVAQFQADFAEDPQGDRVTVDQIKVGYLAQAHYSGNWTLSPVWIFEYHAVRPGHASQKEWTYYDTQAYRMDNGDLYIFD